MARTLSAVEPSVEMVQCPYCTQNTSVEAPADYLDSLGATTNDTESYSLVGIGTIGKGFGFEAYGYHHGNATVSICGQLIRNVLDPAPPSSQNPNYYAFSYTFSYG